MNIKDIVKNNVVDFSRLRQGFVYYRVMVDGALYEFPVSLKDVGDATLYSHEKAILYMRFIRIAIEEGTFIKV